MVKMNALKPVVNVRIPRYIFRINGLLNLAIKSTNTMSEKTEIEKYSLLIISMVKTSVQCFDSM
jgi:hypothetical protein